MASSMNRGLEGMCTLSRPNPGPIQPFIWNGGGKTMKNLRIAGVSAEIRTEHLLNVSLERYSYTELLRKSPRQEVGTSATGYGIT
jgi:hypothetical protein